MCGICDYLSLRFRRFAENLDISGTISKFPVTCPRKKCHDRENGEELQFLVLERLRIGKWGFCFDRGAGGFLVATVCSVRSPGRLLLKKYIELRSIQLPNLSDV